MHLVRMPLFEEVAVMQEVDLTPDSTVSGSYLNVGKPPALWIRICPTAWTLAAWIVRSTAEAFLSLLLICGDSPREVIFGTCLSLK